MSKFCTKCGNPLKDGKCENCDKEKETKEETVSIESNNAIGADLVAIYKNIITKPYTTMKAIYNTGSAKIAWILIAISSAIAGLTTYFFSKKTIIGIMQAVVTKTAGVVGLAGATDTAEMQQAMATMEGQFSNLFGTIFLTGFLMMGIYYIVYALVSKVVVGNIFKGKGTVSEYLLIVAGASVLYSILGVVALVLSFISWKIAGIAIVLGGMVFFVSTVHAYVNILKAKKEKMCYAFAVTNIATAIIATIAFGMVISPIWTSKVNQLTYQGSAVPQTSLYK